MMLGISKYKNKCRKRFPMSKFYSHFEFGLLYVFKLQKVSWLWLFHSGEQLGAFGRRNLRELLLIISRNANTKTEIKKRHLKYTL